MIGLSNFFGSSDRARTMKKKIIVRGNSLEVETTPNCYLVSLSSVFGIIVFVVVLLLLLPLSLL